MVRMDALPNDPELLTILTKQKVDVTVSPGEDPAAGALGGVLSSLAFPLILFLGLLFLTRKSGDEEDGGGGGMGGGGPGGMGNPSTYSSYIYVLILCLFTAHTEKACT
jgi:cell division protease FtsH